VERVPARLGYESINDKDRPKPRWFEYEKRRAVARLIFYKEPSMLTSNELLGFMSQDLALDILNHAYEEDKPVYRATLAAVAEARRLRPVYLERQPRAQRHATMLTTLARPTQEAVAAALLRAWLLKKYKSMLMDFLDALGIEQKDGVVDDLPETMEEGKLRSAVDTILEKYPKEVVAVYLNAFTEMNEVNWPTLDKMLETDQRLQVGS
jgi:hypothetical protein